MSKESLAEGEGFQGGLASPALQEVRSTFIPNVSNLQNLLAQKLFNRWETVFAWRRSDFTTHPSKNWQTRSQRIDKSFYGPSYQVLKNAKLIKNLCNNMFFIFFAYLTIAKQSPKTCLVCEIGFCAPGTPWIFLFCCLMFYRPVK